MAYLGTRASFTNSNGNWVSSNINVYYDVSVNNDYSLSQSQITFTFTTTGTTKIWNHGVIVNVTCNGSTEPASITSGASDKQDKRTILVGCKDGWQKVANYVSGGGGSKSISFTINKTAAAQSFSYTVRAYNGYIANYTTNNGKTEHNDLRNQGLIGDDDGTAIVTAKVNPSVPTIEDLGNNNFKITAYKSPGTSAELVWTVTNADKDTWWVDSNNLHPRITFSTNSHVQTVNLSDYTLDKRPERSVGAGITVFGNNKSSINSAWVYEDITQYWAPGSPSNIQIHKTKNRLTIKEDWRITWDEAEPTNTSSPVAWYRFRLYKKSPTETKFSPIHIYDSKDADRVPLSIKDNEDIYLDIGNVLEYTFNPDYCGIKAKDQVNISIEAYAVNGQNPPGPLRGGRTFMHTEGSGITVQNAGVVRVKVSNTGVSTVDWKEGQVWVKANINGTAKWVEADTVNIKTPNGWKESQ